MLGNGRLAFADGVVDGGVQVGLMGVGGSAGTGAGAGLGAGAGVISTRGTAQLMLSASIQMIASSVSIRLEFFRHITVLIVA
jgi:hypothetical protein